MGGRWSSLRDRARRADRGLHQFRPDVNAAVGHGVVGIENLYGVDRVDLADRERDVVGGFPLRRRRPADRAIRPGSSARLTGRSRAASPGRATAAPRRPGRSPTCRCWRTGPGSGSRFSARSDAIRRRGRSSRRALSGPGPKDGVRIDQAVGQRGGECHQLED